MGAHLARRYITERDTEPDPTGKKEFDPHFGFAERKERGLSTVHIAEKLVPAPYNVFIYMCCETESVTVTLA